MMLHRPTYYTHTHTHIPLHLISFLQFWFILPGAMTFSEILDRVGSMGPSQYLLVTLLALPVLGIANHNLLQIFTATTPAHYCRPPLNASVGPWVLPLGPNGKPEKCLRFVYLPNGSLPNDTQGATEPCLNGWIYNSTRDTIVTEVCPAPSLCSPYLRYCHIPTALVARKRGRGPRLPGIGGQRIG